MQIVDAQVHIWATWRASAARRTRQASPTRECVTLFTEELPWLKGRDLELVMGRALCDWIGWQRPA